jgi:hypothetical protein
MGYEPGTDKWPASLPTAADMRERRDRAVAERVRDLMDRFATVCQALDVTKALADRVEVDVTNVPAPAILAFRAELQSPRFGYRTTYAAQSGSKNNDVVTVSWGGPDDGEEDR